LLDKYRGTVFAQEAPAGLLFLLKFQAPYADGDAASQYATELVISYPRSPYCRSAILTIDHQAIGDDNRPVLMDSLGITAEYYRDTVIGDLANSMIRLLKR
jgi:hypothetical protein